jgi:hypothetical protein
MKVGKINTKLKNLKLKSSKTNSGLLNIIGKKNGDTRN